MPFVTESLLALLVISLFIIFPSFGFFREYELKAFDLMLRLKHKPAPSPLITHIDIDDKSVARIGKWPWSREKHAALIKILNECGARMIAFDILFIESGRALPKSLDSKEEIGMRLKKISSALSDNAQAGLPSLLEEVRKTRAFLETEIVLEDREFREAIHQSKAEIFLPFYIPLDEKEQRLQGAPADESPFSREVKIRGKAAIPSAAKLKMPHEAFLPFLAGSGFVNGEPDQDGVMRKAPLLWRVGDDFYTHLFFEITLRHLGIQDPVFVVSDKDLQVYQDNISVLRVPITPQGEMFINWTGKWPGGFTHIPYAAVLSLDEIRRDKAALYALLDQKYSQGRISAFQEDLTLMKAEEKEREAFELERQIKQKEKELFSFLEKNFLKGKARFRNGSPPAAFTDLSRDFALLQKIKAKEDELKNQIIRYVKDKICIVGLTATGTQDLRPIPLQASYPMAGLNGNLINTILTSTFIRKAPDSWNLSFVVLSGIVVLLATVLSSSLWGALITVLFLCGYSLGAFFALDRAGIWIHSVGPLGCAGLTFATVTTARYALQTLEKNKIKAAFQSYLSREVVGEILKNPEKLRLGGETRDMTLLFADIRGFTSISEKLDAQGLTQFINRFLTPMTEVVLKHRGTIDKYMGDCIMAFWNAPLDDPEHARHACEAALEMRSRLLELNQQLEQDARIHNDLFQRIEMGIGINTGSCCVGNMGSAQRFNYSALGDEVNLASRLEGQSKVYGVNILAGQKTCEQIPGFAFLELDLIRAKGKDKPVRIFALLGNETLGGTFEFKKLRQCHEVMLSSYRSRNWPETKKRIQECRGCDSEKKLEALYDLYLSRVSNFELAPPAPSWDGVYVALTK